MEGFADGFASSMQVQDKIAVGTGSNAKVRRKAVGVASCAYILQSGKATELLASCPPSWKVDLRTYMASLQSLSTSTTNRYEVSPHGAIVEELANNLSDMTLAASDQVRQNDSFDEILAATKEKLEDAKWVFEDVNFFQIAGDILGVGRARRGWNAEVHKVAGKVHNALSLTHRARYAPAPEISGKDAEKSEMITEKDKEEDDEDMWTGEVPENAVFHDGADHFAIYDLGSSVSRQLPSLPEDGTTK